ncbi:phosphate ABC transporter substrate-binding protein PstS [Sulfurimonas sp. SWIR-19]|uniref:phosphate ABC transporter substrate-binding protein PstS n=1 Tax=Sulfurimonas sp. SWIR-19 TaxID=2878390 RepID=UPI001CF10C54|nr:phosphate ABC transporter substrate-binding protein PstS [Sulfurimonas sp. SWIR-19]UCM99954.1 phosphate ABC transporter substrate-binding protein PstS [Sulfurimonas sp. SWIR-19]
MTKVIKLALVASVLAGGLSANDVLKGSGASFPYSVYQKWTKAYYKATGIKVDYISKGSSKGIKDAKARQVDFAGTDKPLSPKVLKQNNLYQFPGVVGAITMGYNIPGVSNLKLSRSAIVAISEGKIKYWDNKLITAANAGLKLPHEKVTFVHRADGSGTTFNYTYFLSKVSKEWRHTYGAKKSLNWPGNQHIGGNKNTGVASLIKQTPYSVGYIDYADAQKNGIVMASVQNREGHYIKPELKAFQIAAAKANLDPKKDFYSIIADPKGADSYPIVAATFILVPAEKPEMDKKVTAFFDWSYKNGQEIAKSLGFVPLPDALTDKIRKYWEEKGIR